MAVVPGLEPLAAIGAGLDVISALSGTAGDVIDAGSKSSSELQTAGKELTAPKTALGLSQSGQVASQRIAD